MVKNLDVPPEDFPPDGATQEEISLWALGRSLRFPRSTMEDTPLESALFALQIIIGHLGSSGVDFDLLKPLSDLSEALDDLAIGKKNDLLITPLTKDGDTKKGGKRLHRIDALNKAKAAAAIKLSGRGHMAETTQRAARKLKIQPKTLENFRRNISTHKIKDPFATSHYCHYISHFGHQSLERRQDIIEEIIRSLNPIRSA